MNLGELKKSLTRFPPDMDEVEVLIQYGNDKGELDADCLTFVACASFPEKATAAVILGSWKCADIMQKESPRSSRRITDNTQIQNRVILKTQIQMKNRKSNRRPRNRLAIFYKSHGQYIGPYCGITLSKKQITNLRQDGTLSEISNYVLRSPLQLRRRVA